VFDEPDDFVGSSFHLVRLDVVSPEVDNQVGNVVTRISVIFNCININNFVLYTNDFFNYLTFSAIVINRSTYLHSFTIIKKPYNKSSISCESIF